MASRRPERDATFVAAVAAAVIGGVFAVAAAGVGGAKPAMSVVLGAGIAVANLLTLRAIVRSMMTAPEGDVSEPVGDVQEPAEDPATSPENTPQKTLDHRRKGRFGGTAWALFGVVKIGVLFGAIWLLLARHLVDPIPLVLGYVVLPLGIVASTFVGSLRPR